MREVLGCGLVMAALAGCGNVSARAADAAVDAPVNRCAPDPCLLADEFDGPTLNSGLWGTTVAGGATITQSAGILSLRLPPAANAYADLFSLVGFPVGTSFEARVRFNDGQFYDHKGVGFASGRVGSGCDTGESDAAMFRGQDEDAYVETKLAGNAMSACVLTGKKYMAGPHTMKVTRATDQVVYSVDGVALGPIKTGLPTSLLPIRFSAYTFTTAPGAAVQIDVDWVAVSRP